MSCSSKVKTILPISIVLLPILALCGMLFWWKEAKDGRTKITSNLYANILNVYETKKLNVLEVWDTEVVAGTDYYAIIPVYGTYQVDLENAEIIQDAENHYIEFRLPFPEIDEPKVNFYDIYTTKHENINETAFSFNFITEENKTYTGFKAAADDQKEAVKAFKKEIIKEDEYIKSAKKNTKTVLENLCKSIDEKCTVEVVWYEQDPQDLTNTDEESSENITQIQ